MTLTPPAQPRRTDDSDPTETAEWIDAIESLTRQASPERANFVLNRVLDHARLIGVTTSGLPYSAYRNSIPVA